MSSRRTFLLNLKNSALGGALLSLGGAASLATSGCATSGAGSSSGGTDAGGGCCAAGAGAGAPKTPLAKGAVILFQGDSITDAGRSRKNTGANNPDALGRGYPVLAAGEILRRFAGLEPRVFNRGISGNKVHQLAARWDGETIALKPDVLSILIGVNDHWHSIGGGYKGTPEIYEKDYRALLKRTVAALPAARLVICEPFVLKGGGAIKNEAQWFPVFDRYREIAKKLAGEFNTLFVPFQSAFDDAMKTAPAKYWSPDGVHPSLAGAQLMATVWLKTVFG